MELCLGQYSECCSPQEVHELMLRVDGTVGWTHVKQGHSDHGGMEHHGLAAASRNILEHSNTMAMYSSAI